MNLQSSFFKFEVSTISVNDGQIVFLTSQDTGSAMCVCVCMYIYKNLCVQ